MFVACAGAPSTPRASERRGVSIGSTGRREQARATGALLRKRSHYWSDGVVLRIAAVLLLLSACQFVDNEPVEDTTATSPVELELAERSANKRDPVDVAAAGTPSVTTHAPSGRDVLATFVTPQCPGFDLDAAEGNRGRVYEVESFGAKGDGVTDDSDAINRAVNSVPAGSVVQLASGRTYVKRKVVRLERAGVQLSGYGATIRSDTTSEEVARGKGQSPLAIRLHAPDTSVVGVRIVSNLRQRLVGHPNDAAVFVGGVRQRVMDVRIEYTSIGILVAEASGFTVARNVVLRTHADGIHVTGRAYGGKVLCNVVRETGDDMIAVVDYGRGFPKTGGVLISGNDVAGQYWGRGIAVVGGLDITIRDNRVASTTHGAGILIASESGYGTADVRNVVVEGNEISDVQMSDAVYNPTNARRKTGHSAILLAPDSGHSIRHVLVRNNSVDLARSGGIRIGGQSCDVGVFGNSMTRVLGGAIDVGIGNREDCPIGCADNRVDGAPRMPAGCGLTVPNATGAADVVR